MSDDDRKVPAKDTWKGKFRSPPTKKQRSNADFGHIFPIWAMNETQKRGAVHLHTMCNSKQNDVTQFKHA